MDKNKIKSKLPGIEAIGDFISTNGSTLSLIGSIVLIGMSLYSAFKAADEVYDIRERYEEKVQNIDPTTPEGAQIAKELRISRDIRYVLAYKYALLCGGGAIALEILGYSLSGKAIATLTAALALEKDRAKKLIENGRELIGEEKFKQVEDKTLEQLVEENFFPKDGPIAIKPQLRKGQFFIETNKGIIFQMNKTELEDVLKKAKEYCERNHGLPEEKFYEDFLGIEAPTMSKFCWWGPKNPFDAHIGNRTCFGMSVESIEYANIPQTAQSAGVPWA